MSNKSLEVITMNFSYNNLSSSGLDLVTRDGLVLVEYNKVWTSDVLQRVVTLTFLIALTLLGNISIIVILIFSKYHQVKSRVNIFIINLAVGDLAVCCVTMTTEIFFVVFDKAWVLGGAACKILLYGQIVTLASTTFILTAMSFDRYLAICKPLSFARGSRDLWRPKFMILVAWIMAFVFASPQLLIFTQVAVGIYPDGQIKYKCKSAGYTAWWQRKTYFTFMTSYILLIPAAIISFCYINVARVVWNRNGDIASPQNAKKTNHPDARNQVTLRRTMHNVGHLTRAKLRTVKMTLSIICSFIICWSPYFLVHLIHIWSEYQIRLSESVYAFVENLALLNSALNPILYGCFNIQLRRGLTDVCCPNSSTTSDKRSKVMVMVSLGASSPLPCSLASSEDGRSPRLFRQVATVSPESFKSGRRSAIFVYNPINGKSATVSDRIRNSSSNNKLIINNSVRVKCNPTKSFSYDIAPTLCKRPKMIRKCITYEKIKSGDIDFVISSSKIVQQEENKSKVAQYKRSKSWCAEERSSSSIPRKLSIYTVN